MILSIKNIQYTAISKIRTQWQGGANVSYYLGRGTKTLSNIIVKGWQRFQFKKQSIQGLGKKDKVKEQSELIRKTQGEKGC